MARSPSPIECDPLVRRTPREEVDVLYPACVAMYTEEVGVSPENDAGGGDLYRARIQQLIGRGWSMASFDEHGVVFKAEVACVTPHAAQVQGVWVRPDRRGEGLATRGMASVVHHVLGTGTAPVVSLYVNDWNAAARATATPCRCPPDNVSTAWLTFLMPIFSSARCRAASARILGMSRRRNTVPASPFRRSSRPR